MSKVLEGHRYQADGGTPRLCWCLTGAFAHQPTLRERSANASVYTPCRGEGKAGSSTNAVTTCTGASVIVPVGARRRRLCIRQPDVVFCRHDHGPVSGAHMSIQLDRLELMQATAAGPKLPTAREAGPRGIVTRPVS